MPPRTRWACTTVQYSLQCCTLTRPPLVRTHTSNPAFPTGGGLGGFVTFAYGAVGRRGHHPIEGAIPLPPPLGEGLTCRLAGVAAAGRADVRRWQRRAVAAAGSGGLWRAWSRRAAAGRAMAAAGCGSGGQRRVAAGMVAVGSGGAGGGSGGAGGGSCGRWQRRAAPAAGSGGRGRGG